MRVVTLNLFNVAAFTHGDSLKVIQSNFTARLEKDKQKL